MSVRVTIGTQVIDLPSPGADPNWAEAWDNFATAVANQLQAIASVFDVAPQVQILSSDSNTNLDVADCIFPSGSVRSFTMYYAIYRKNTTTSIKEQGEISGIYDTLNSTWIIKDQYNGDRATDGTPYHAFNMSGDQLQLSTVAIGGSYDSVNSTISYSAKTELVTE